MIHPSSMAKVCITERFLTPVQLKPFFLNPDTLYKIKVGLFKSLKLCFAFVNLILVRLCYKEFSKLFENPKTFQKT